MTLGDKWPTFPPLSRCDRDEAHRLLDAFSRQRERQTVTYARRLEAVAYRSGRQVASGAETLDTVTRRLDAFAYRLDPDAPVLVGVLSPERAREIVARAFAAGVRDERSANVG